MKSYLNHKDKYFKDFANLMVKKYKQLKFGIASPKGLTDPYLIGMRYELSAWQSSEDFSTISQLKIAYKDWMPISIDTCDDLCYININNITNIGVAKQYNITVASTVWVLNHNLGFNPNITTTDNNGQEIFGSVTYVNQNTISVTFSSPVTGWAYLS
jgi:hypothetical protein